MTAMNTTFPRICACALALVALSMPANACFAQALATTATEHFEALDSNGDGRVDASEYGSSNLFAQLDGDRNNRITAEELDAILGPQQDGMPSAADRIRIADGNGDGELSDEELRRNGEMQFARLDGNSDGYLDLAEMKSGFGIPIVATPR